jgi:hypothetical protein
VRPATTVADEGVLHSQADLSAFVAGFARVGWIDKHRCDARSGCFVGDKLLQLPKRPAMEPRLDPFARVDAVENTCEVFHRNRPRADAFRLGDDLPAHDVVHVTHAPSLSARDFPKQLLGAFGAVALSAAAQGKMLVTLESKLTTSPDFARTAGGQIVFSDIQPQNGADFLIDDLLLDYEVEEPFASTPNQLRLPWRAPLQQALLVFTRFQRNYNTSFKRVERQQVAAHGEGALVKMYRCVSKVDRRNRRVSRELSIRVHGTVRRRHGAQDVAAHLRPQWRIGPHLAIGQRVKPESVPTARCRDNWYNEIARIRVGGLQRGERGLLGRLRQNLDRCRAHSRRHFKFVHSSGHHLTLLREALKHYHVRSTGSVIPSAIEVASFLVRNV